MRQALVHAMRARGVDVTTALEEAMIHRRDAAAVAHAAQTPAAGGPLRRGGHEDAYTNRSQT